MLKLLNVDDFVQSLTPVTAIEFFDRAGNFHSQGLFSERIFGPIGANDRRQTFSYIDLHTKVIHPTMLKIIMQLDRKVEKFLSTEEYFSLDSDGLLQKDERGVTGFSEFIKLFPKIKFRGETSTRDKLIQLIERERKNNTIFISKIPVIPPDLRPATKDENNNWMIDQLNNIYVSIMRRALQVKSSGSGPLKDLLVYALQNSVVEHDQYIRSKIQKKSGIIRNQMLGKRVDFSGRAVISPDPHIKLGQVGVPFRMAVSLFEPFIIHRLLYSGRVNKNDLEQQIQAYLNVPLSVDSIRKVLKSVKDGDILPAELFKIFYEATEVAMMNRVVVLKRDPVLHAQSYMAYYPVLHTGNTIRLSTLQVGGHNADFDGDQMAIYHPLTREAQEEARQKMMNLTSGTSSTSLSYSISKEMWVGLYTITKDKKLNKSAIAVTNEDLDKIKDPYIPVKYRGVTTTAGKAIYNSCFPRDFPFQHEQATKKTVGSILEKLYDKYGQKGLKESSDRLKDAGFKWATIMAPSLNIDNFILPPRIYEIKKRLGELSEEQVDEAQALLDEAQKIVQKELDNTGFGDLVESGTAKGWGQPMQILVAKGITADPQGRLLKPIAGSFSEGLSNREFFDASQGARKGIVDRVINTADTGYMARKLAYLLNTIELDRNLKDCKTKRTLTIKLDKNIIGRFRGRYVVHKGKLMLFEEGKFKAGDVVELRSPIYCESKKICHTCYGKLLERHRTPFVGILASQVIGEPGTQLIMRTFHTGGAVSIVKRDMLGDIISNDPLSGLE